MTTELNAAIVAAAQADAEMFWEEFSGQNIEGNWDATAWEISQTKIAAPLRHELEQLNDVAGSDIGWEIYREVLHGIVRS